LGPVTGMPGPIPMPAANVNAADPPAALMVGLAANGGMT